MKPRAIYRAWGRLVALSLASTMLSRPEIWAIWPACAGVLVLLLAWLKARIILAHYLGLAEAPSWRGGFYFVLAMFCLIMLGLFLVPLATAMTSV